MLILQEKLKNVSITQMSETMPVWENERFVTLPTFHNSFDTQRQIFL